MSKRGWGTIATLVLILMLAGCGTSTAGSPVATSGPEVVTQSLTPEIPANPSAQVGTGGELVAIRSDNVQAAGYDAATGTMTVLFDSGGLYEYYDVSPELWEDFVAAQPHPWSAIGDPQLVKGGYSYRRIG